MDRLVRVALPSVALGAGFLLGVFAHALLGTTDHPLDTPIQVALVAGSVGLTVGAIGLMGVVIGAVASARAGKEARLDEYRLRRFEEALALSQKHAHDIAQQVASRAAAAKNLKEPGSVAPAIGSTDPIEEAINVLYLFARQETADAAVAMYSAALSLSAYSFDAKKDVVAGQISELIPELDQQHRIDQGTFLLMKTRYIDAARKELGLAVLRDTPKNSQRVADRT